ncbi:MAG TPA: glucose-1-phosphate cytidylyltransferase [Solirubrobacteraceae bacterium]|nr:glucose-1-phosphate cytidylyltransferase [Solirubrobacteraceae bacterium]
MKAVILAGGSGSRLAEETALRPKPMVEIGGRPILWHIMKIYAAQGIEEFVICAGYKGYVIKEYFANYRLHSADATFDLGAGTIELAGDPRERWRVAVIDTGEHTQTGGRLRRVLPLLGEEEFCFTYGDGLADIDLGALLACHRREGRIATVTAVQPRGRYGAIELERARVSSFEEKPRGDGRWVNGGFFVLSPRIGEYLDSDQSVFEREPLRALAAAGELAAYRHEGFWEAMDTLRDRRHLESLWAGGSPPWRIWDERA